MNDANDDLGNFSKSNECMICGQIHDRGYVSKPPIPASDRTKNARLLGMIVLSAFLFVAFMQIITPNYMGRTRASWERAAVNNLRTIEQAEESYRQDHGRYGTFEDLIDASELTADWDIPLKGHYLFSIKASGESLALSARPMNYEGETKLSFLMTAGAGDKNGDFSVHAADKKGKAATMKDPIIDR